MTLQEKTAELYERYKRDDQMGDILKELLMAIAEMPIPLIGETACRYCHGIGIVCSGAGYCDHYGVCDQDNNCGEYIAIKCRHCQQSAVEETKDSMTQDFVDAGALRQPEIEALLESISIGEPINDDMADDWLTIGETATQETKSRMTKDFVDAGVINPLELARKPYKYESCINDKWTDTELKKRIIDLEKSGEYYEKAIQQESEKRIYFEEYAKEFKTELDTAEKRWNELKNILKNRREECVEVGSVNFVHMIDIIISDTQELEKDGD